MKWLGSGKIKMEEGEPAMRSCWECNEAHKHLKKVNMLHVCFACGKYWIFDRFFDSFKSPEDFENFFKSLGIKEGESTSKIDSGYRVTQIFFGKRDG